MPILCGVARHRIVLTAAVVALALALVACSPASHKAQPTEFTVATPANLVLARVSPVAGPAIDGFGASGAWWPNDLARFPLGVRQTVARMLFSPDGLRLSGYRYNIGGGGAGVTTSDRAPKEFSADVGGRWFLRSANDAHVPILTGFVNSAPPRFTTNGNACGGSLKPGMEARYAAYLVDVVRALHDHDHITLQYISPMNEPDNSFGGCGQEGMQVPVSQRAAVVHALGRELARRAPYTKIIADETTADALAANEVPAWLAVPGTARYVAAIAHHTYDFPNDALRKLLPPMAARFARPTWMTETCCYKGSGGVASSFGAGYDPTMTQGFWLADQIQADLTVAGDRAWYWWTALSPVIGCDPKLDPTCPARANTRGFNDGLLYYDEHGPADAMTTIFTTKRFFVLGQFSRYVRPGAVRHDIAGLPAGLHAMAFSTGTSWTVVAWNESTSGATFGLELPGRRLTAKDAAVTDRSRELAPGALPLRTTGGAWLVHLPASTIVTYTFT